MKLLNKKPNKIDISFNGEGEWTAGDIQKNSAEIEILNPELHIATRNKNAKFDVELRVGKGKGYIPASENVSPDYTIGVIPIDSIFTPIKNVKFEVEMLELVTKMISKNYLSKSLLMVQLLRMMHLHRLLK